MFVKHLKSIEMSDFYLAAKPSTATSSSPSTPITKTPDTPTASTPTEKIIEEPSKSITDDNPDGEEIADDLSEISDEADEILGQQEVCAQNTFSYSILFSQEVIN